MARYDGAIRILTRINTKGMQRGESDIRKSLERIAGLAKKCAAIVASAFAVGQLIQFGKEALEAASDLEAVESQFSQVFGNLEQQASESLSRIAKQTGITEQRMKASFTKIAAFAKTTGMDTEGALELADRAMVAVADSAAFYDRSLEETTESLQSFLKGNYENDAALGLSATEFTRNAAANKLYGKSFIELSEAQKQLTLLQMVEDANRLSGALGQASRESDTWVNQIGNLNQAWTTLKANLGRFILPAAVQAVKAITSVINAINALLARLFAVTGALRSFSELITGKKSQGGGSPGMSQKEGESIGAGYDTAAAGAENLASANEDAAQAAKEAGKAAKGQLSTLDKLNNLSSGAANKADSEGVDGAGFPEIPEIDYGTLEEGETIIDRLSGALAEIWNVFRQAWEKNGQSVVNSAKSALESLLKAAKSVGKTFYEVFTGGAGLAWVNSLLGQLRSILDTVHVIADAFSTAWNSGAGYENVTALFNMLTNLNILQTSIGDSFNRVFSNGIGVSIWTNILGIVTGVYNIIGNLAASLTEAWNTAGIGDSIWEGILGIANTVLETIHSIADSTAEWAEKLDFTPLLQSIDGLLKAIQPLAENIGGGLKWFWDNVLLPIAGWTIEDVVPAFLDMLSAAIGALNSAIEVLKPFGEWLWENFLQPLGEWSGGVIVSVIESIVGILTQLGNWISEHSEAIQKFITIVAPIAGVVLAIANAGTILSAAVSALSTAFALLTSPVTLIIAAIAALAAGFVYLYENSEEFRNFIDTALASVIEDILAPAFNYLAETVLPMVISAFETLWNNVLVPLGEFVMSILQPIIENLSTILTFLWQNVIVPLAEFIGGVLSTVFENVVDIFINIVIPAINNMIKVFQFLWNNVFSPIVNFLRSTLMPVFSNVFDTIGEIIRNAKKIFEGLIDFIVGFFTRDWDKAWNGVAKILDGVFGVIKGIINGIIGGIEWMANAVINGINTIIGALDGLHFEIPEWVPLLGGKSFGFNIGELSQISIPRLATGTVVPPNNEFLAVLGDNTREHEVVSPVSTIEEAVENVLRRNGGAGGVKELTVHVPVQINERVLFDIIKKLDLEQFKRTGVPTFQM